MPNAPRLIPTTEPKDAEAVVLVLHGGASRRDNPMVSPTQLSVLRMIPVARRVARAGAKRLAVYRVLNSTRGWDTTHTPVDDARWAIAQVEERLGTSLPIGLVGHSLGGRAAILAGAEPGVQSVVALNPWVYPQDGDVDLSGRQVLVAHGTEDRIADPAKAKEAARRISRSTDVSFVDVRGGKHAMLARHGTFDGLAADFTAGVLLDGHQPGVASRALAGDMAFEV
ncbi:hypothetical protein ASD11_02005 [Aeromicrobium sp. Root495]|uniref:alpha/beta hydrolase n=1 Tax=Aeromicrobium sp. Root495 TaxID=1736550 RepID=UPI0006FF1207|nr:alpha/beta hydrolase [Aeromicrobium sp. Root495]KQY58461.1 hypothetical protein ASD11_02005 [Aeromicrobium sp. Root495]RYJ06270.1 MAG: alpha/beta hydrolase [Actinomycetales bacterium]